MGYELYSDDQLLDATGLHIDNVRKLVTWGAVRPAKGGRGRGNVRMWTASTVRHVACIAALTDAGMSLKMAHTVVYLDVVGDVFFDIIDPTTLAMNAGDRHGWFDPERPLKTLERGDFRLAIADGKYVFFHSVAAKKPIPKGILEENGTIFRTFVDFAHYSGVPGADGRLERLQPKWEPVPGFVEVDPGSLAWVYDPSLDSNDVIDWRLAFDAAVSMTTVNLSLACKIAMRRLLKLPVFFAVHSNAETDGGADST